MARATKREEMAINPEALPFHGVDIWNHYEVSWLNPKGKPNVATAEIRYECSTPFIVESKSLKLYFNSLNNSEFATPEQIEKTIQQDLEKIIGAPVSVCITPLAQAYPTSYRAQLDGESIDDLDVSCHNYTVDTSTLITTHEQVTETLTSDLLKSNCLVTNQPDWGSVQINYSGNKIDRAGLLQYIVSFRNHNEFHEQCIERIFVDIMAHCHPTELTVYGRYTRRGGIDINPLRSTNPTSRVSNDRLMRQ
ncbi:MAG: NADPH-dependent 7-cyano-7-deazaguanine reductase QueF [Coxiellaceae bacterium]|nr:NADPH-dependent 7-cyano-7-deazaguanine reductase QueF [Coxiellaceae bacterium]